jgi:hypothetical protein
MNHCTPVASGETLVSARGVDHETDRLPRIEAGKVKDWALDGRRGLSWGCVVLRNDTIAVLYNDAPGRVEVEGLVTGLGDRWRRVRRMRRRRCARSTPIQSIRFTPHASPNISLGVEGWPRSTHCRDRLSRTRDTVRVETLDRGKLVGDLPEPVASRLSRAPVAHRDRAAAF